MTGDGRMPNASTIEDLLVEQMRRDLTKPKWWQTIVGRIAISGGVLALGAMTAIAAVVLLDERAVSEATIVHCLDRDSRNLDGTLPGSAVSLATPDGVVPLGDAISACKAMWASGALSSNDPLEPTPAPGTVPSTFTLCVTDEGAAAVVPGRVECSVLDLHPYSPND